MIAYNDKQKTYVMRLMKILNNEVVNRYKSYNCQKAIQNTKQNSDLSIIRVEVSWNCNLNQI